MTLWKLILAGLALVAFGWAASHFIRRETVFEYQHAIRFVRGQFVDVLPAGVHWLFLPTTRVQLLDSRPRVLTIPGQDVLSADSVSLKVSLVLDVQVVDPRAAILQAANFEETLYAAAQVALREAIGSKPMEEILGIRAELAARLKPAVEPTAKALGLELRSMSIKDIMLPGPLKDAFSQTARAKQEAQAAVERARGESAALRNLANAARLLSDNPALAQLRLLQTAATADKLVINYAPGDTPAVLPGGRT